ncbi:MAG: hypothetical protein IGS38_16245 [Synechococcales cyanobacterium M58_A2018_015]|nr:hypothetical protein [Synechococcales cyanobacterium M58_A2018_015]
MPLPSFVAVTKSLLEIDHCFVCLPNPVEADALAVRGLTCAGQPLRRTDQGTAAQILFFENAYLELIWIEDRQAAVRYGMQTGIDFLARAQQQASPFGIALRQTPDAVDRPSDLLPSNATLNRSQTFLNFAADNLASRVEPLCFIIPDAVSLLSLLDRTSLLHQQLIRHPAGMQRLTSTRITIAAVASREPCSDSVNLLQREGIAEVFYGKAPLLELSFDHQRQGQTLDLSGLGLPLVLRY